jgi:hypothetical protein
MQDEEMMCENGMFHVVPCTGIRSFIQTCGGGVLNVGFFHNLEHHA